MSELLQQNDATYPIVFGPLVLASDHISPATGLTLTVTLSKNGGGFASPAGAVSEVGNGYYQIAAHATDKATLGKLIVHATGSGADVFDANFQVVAFNPADAVALGLSRLDAAVSADTAGVTTLLSRIIGTIAAGTHNPQGGDAHAYLTTNLGLLGVALSAIPKTGFKLAADGLPTMPTDWITAAGVSAAAVAKIEAALLNEGDGQALINAMVAAIDAADIDADELPALVGAWILNRVLAGNHDTAGTPGKILQDIVAKTVNLPAAPASTGDVTAARDSVLTAVGTPLQAGSYTAPDNAGIGDAVMAAGAAATAAGAAQTAAETAATAAAAAATESEVQAIVDAIKGAGWTTETLKAIFDKPGAALSPEQIDAIATGVSVATIAAIGVDGVAVSTIKAAALAAIRLAVSGAVVVVNSPVDSTGRKLRLTFGDRYGEEFDRPLTFDISRDAVPWLDEGTVALRILVGKTRVEFSGDATFTDEAEAVCSFTAVAADWTGLSDGPGKFAVVQRYADGTEKQTIHSGDVVITPAI